jgi:hypothetical protein
VTTLTIRQKPGLSSVRRSVIFGLALFAASVLLLGLTLASLVQPTRAVVWGGLGLGAFAAGLLCLVGVRQRRGLGLTTWKIGPWTLVWYGATFGIATVSWSQQQTGVAAEITVESVLRALWLVAVGTSFWALGYAVGPGRYICRCADRGLAHLSYGCGPTVRSPAAPWILYSIGLAARITAAVTSGRLGYVGDASAAVSTATGYAQVLSVISLCAPLAVAAAAIQVSVRN